jgi:hypothetical protein
MTYGIGYRKGSRSPPTHGQAAEILNAAPPGNLGPPCESPGRADPSEQVDRLRYVAFRGWLRGSRCRDALAALSAYAVASLSRLRSHRTDPALKTPVAEAIWPLQLVDRTVLEGMGPPTVGFDARSELPTDPHGPSGASVGRTLRGDADFPKNELRLCVAIRRDCWR